MFSKNLKYYRLKTNMTKKDLAARCNITSINITYYESGERKPSMETMKLLAKALGVRVSDFLAVRNENLHFCHGEFRKKASLSQHGQEYVRESVEEYFNRFYSAVEILGGEVLPEAPACGVLPITGDPEEDARALRAHLNLSSEGPVGNLIEILENKGILVFSLNFENDDFSGMNGFVENRPYIVINSQMTTERNRTTIVHELAHFMFEWPEGMEEKEAEDYATAVGGAFLFPKTDVARELGVHRSKITKDMLLVCKEYGISMLLLVKRARISKVISDVVERDFYIRAGQKGWRKSEPSRIKKEQPRLFEQLVYRAVNEQEISVQRGAELLCVPYTSVVEHCFFDER